MAARTLTRAEREKLAALRIAEERLKRPGAVVTVDERTDEDGQPIYRVSYLDPPKKRGHGMSEGH